MTEVGAACRVVLVGMMGSGKTTVGRLLAARTGWPFLDNDELLERQTGRSAKQLLASVGEDELREAEAGALALGLECEPPCLVGAAAGTILDGEIRRRLRTAAVVVWLRAAPDTLAQRAVGGEHRPWLAQDPIGWMRSTDEARAPLYESVADISIDTGRLKPAESAIEIIQRLRQSHDCARFVPPPPAPPH